ncbi:MAG: hypothetical protein R6U31_07610, partial [bacterium]
MKQKIDKELLEAIKEFLPGYITWAFDKEIPVNNIQYLYMHFARIDFQRMLEGKMDDLFDKLWTYVQSES